LGRSPSDGTRISSTGIAHLLFINFFYFALAVNVSIIINIIIIIIMLSRA